MKAISIIIATCLAAGALALSGLKLPASSNGRDKNHNSDKGFVVVELFTSEGCSSCPPADALVARLQKENNDQPVYILAFHVDYWNRLGWKDVFSTAAFSDRQNRYANWLHLQSVYTPQVVVNGSKEFVGSEERTLRNAIRTNLQKASPAKLDLRKVNIDQGQVNLQYHTDGTSGSMSLLLAVVQKSATINVQGGENRGRTLTHVQIVRNFETVDLNGKDSGNVRIKLPTGVSPQELELVAFMQNNGNGEITAANRVGLN